MKKAILMAMIAVVVTACGSRTNKETGADGSIVTPDEEKLSEEYIRQRFESIYSCYDNPQYDESGLRVMESRGNFDSAYCSSSYKELLAQAEALAGEDDIVLDYDHWTNSQDDNNFTCKVGNVSLLTDSTAVVEMDAQNFAEPYTITLALLFERGDWYVDNFLSTDGSKGEKEYLQEYIQQTVTETIRRFYEDYVFYGNGKLTIEEAVKKYCTKKLTKKLKDDYEFDGESYAIWDFRGKDWSPGDSDAHKVDDIQFLGDGNYQVEYRDGNQKMSCIVKVIIEGDRVLFDEVH